MSDHIFSKLSGHGSASQWALIQVLQIHQTNAVFDNDNDDVHSNNSSEHCKFSNKLR